MHQTPGPFPLPAFDADSGHFGDQNGAPGDRQTASSAAPAAGEAVPCLLRNNSDGIREKLCGNDRKRAEATRQNLQQMAKVWGSGAGVLTLTFAEDISTREAQRKLANFKRRVLKDNFGDFITIREFTARGRPHFHLLVDCKGDIAEGFDWDHYDRVREWSRAGRKGAKPKGRLGSSPLLSRLHLLLREKAPLYGFGAFVELTPVRFPEAVGFYLGGYLSKSLAHRPEDAKGTRSVNYSHKCPRVFRGGFSFNSPGNWCWRSKLAKFAEKHGCASFPELRALLGSRWAYHHRAAIQGVRLDHYPTAAHASADGLNVPEGATGIYRQVWVDGVKDEPKKVEVVRHPSWDAPAPEPRKYQLSREWSQVPWAQRHLFYGIPTASKVERSNCVQGKRTNRATSANDRAGDASQHFRENAPQARTRATRKSCGAR